MNEECKNMISRLESILNVSQEEFKLIATAIEVAYTRGLCDGLKESISNDVHQLC